ncbi:beta-alanine-activating enzyme isoform X2 [Bradysia coprophila]|uniref:beta-alanine-activating enzyme isoform X2 n=1 Tax=Bradysia coprophila TaxID=38358 RepID=UPI00187D7D60|nr:beta-alanine-activating enzyme isoform X2 [Bradysia coprophila]
MFSSEKLFGKYGKGRAIIWQSSNQDQEQFSYDELIKASKIVETTIRECTRNGQNNIGVLLNHSAEIVPVIIGILDASATFCCLNETQSPDELKEMIDLFRCNIGIADESFVLTHKEYEALKEINVFNKSLVVIRLSVDNLPTGNNPPRNIVEGNDLLLSSKPMFCCSTSGTTGKPKLVNVPFKCLMPNVMSLSNHYKITPSDVIYISSPPTFDPFVVDLCLGLFNGATILMVSNEIRLSTKLLLSSIDMTGVTIMQITPSLFRRFPVEAIQSLLASSSNSLRCLILGGESFPSMEEVALWFTVNDEIQMHARLFNIYGITEVSCWSTIYELTSADIECKNLIPIGLPLDHYTTLKVVDCVDKEIIENGIGELFIESKVRICDVYENGQLNNISGSVATGDLVEIKSGTIYYKTRVNNMVKIFGRKVNLTKIENVAKANWPVKDACCVYDKDTNSLNLFVQCTKDRTYSKREVLQGLRQKLLEQEVPNELHFTDEFPLSCHGKVSKSKLLEMVRKPSTDFHQNYFLTRLEEHLPNFDVKITLQSSFLAAGGSSVLALQLINDLESKFNLVDPELIAMLLNTDLCMERILLSLHNHRSGDLPIKTVKSASHSFTWSHDLTKCIDATPSICIVDNRSIVSVGSHSHILVNVDLLSGAGPD